MWLNPDLVICAMGHQAVQGKNMEALQALIRICERYQVERRVDSVPPPLCRVGERQYTCWYLCTERVTGCPGWGRVGIRQLVGRFFSLFYFS